MPTHHPGATEGPRSLTHPVASAPQRRPPPTKGTTLTMTNPATRAPYSRHTVPALQQMADTVRRKADEAAAEAADLARAANELDEIAGHVARFQQATTPGSVTPPTGYPCTICGQPLYDDGLGPRHHDPSKPCTPPTQQLADSPTTPNTTLDDDPAPDGEGEGQ